MNSVQNIQHSIFNVQGSMGMGALQSLISAANVFSFKPEARHE